VSGHSVYVETCEAVGVLGAERGVLQLQCSAVDWHGRVGALVTPVPPTYLTILAIIVLKCKYFCIQNRTTFLNKG
jgi:hypothetical protein